MYTILTDSEITDITRFVAAQTAGRAVVTACGGWALPKTLEFAEACREWGIDAFLLSPPDWAGASTDNTLEAYYTAVARRIPIVPMTSMRGRPLPLSLIGKLLDSKIDIVGVKDDVCCEYGRRLAALVNGRCAFLSGGHKHNYLDHRFYGDVSGYLSAFIRFMPKVAWLFYDAVERHDFERAVSVIKVFEFPFFDGKPNVTAGIELHFSAAIHAAMEVYGICERWQRLPYQSATDEQMELLRDFLKQLETKLRDYE